MPAVRSVLDSTLVLPAFKPVSMSLAWTPERDMCCCAVLLLLLSGLLLGIVQAGGAARGEAGDYHRCSLAFLPGSKQACWWRNIMVSLLVVQLQDWDPGSILGCQPVFFQASCGQGKGLKGGCRGRESAAQLASIGCSFCMCTTVTAAAAAAVGL
jgi:hypothetical protein